MKPLILYVAALAVATACFILSTIISSVVNTSHTPPLPFYIISTRAHNKEANTTQDHIQPQRGLPYSLAPPSPRGILHFYKSLQSDAPITLRCSSCSVVSSSGFLISKGAGKDIDRKHCVIRMNLAPVKGHHRDVGTRTTLRIMNFIAAPLASRMPIPDQAIFIWGLYLDDRPTIYMKKVEEMSTRIGRRTNIVSLTLEGERYASSLFARETGRSLEKIHSRPSTGWYTMMLAADLCREIHVYGMVPPDYCSVHPNSTVRYHYFEKFSKDECTVYRETERTTGKRSHRFLAEKSVYARWAARYNISFHIPKWNINYTKKNP